MYKEKKIASLQQGKNRLQLLKLTNVEDLEQTNWELHTYGEQISNISIKYQVRLNRKVIETSISEYQCRNIFAKYAQNIVLQLKIY